ncbi:Origin recognition complex subunit 4 [Psilocybe cubensis]|uniref:Origin recognition complex subunit 4 n=2 Tax=Psilocybe cubensis TaxID=181762 RepID=A0ACB8H426_PSICU|nr:Origin recognition complex subunit 4 [Psilocybe cubensis]KAH9482663.1 Origin recognition complex subunit 4 [Psilocybe cubensis]
MPPKRKQAPQAEVQIQSKRPRTRGNSSVVDPPTENHVTPSRQDRKSSTRKPLKDAGEADASASNSNIPNNVVAIIDNESLLRKAGVAKVYGKAARRPRTRKDTVHSIETHTSPDDDPPVHRQLRSSTTTEVVIVMPDAKAPSKRTAKRTTSNSTILKEIADSTETPTVKKSRRRTTTVAGELETMVEEPEAKAPPKRMTRRRTAATIIETDTVPNIPKNKRARRTRSTTIVDTYLEAPDSVEVVHTKELSRANYSEPPETVSTIDGSKVEELFKTVEGSPLFSEVESIDDNVSMTRPRSSLTPTPTYLDGRSSLAQNISIPPNSAALQKVPLTEASTALPVHLHPFFYTQKRSIMKMLQRPIFKVDAPELEVSVNVVAASQLAELIEGTVMRAEGNSCLLLGPRGSGKSAILEDCLQNLPSKPIIIRLSGWVQSTDRHAIREIAIQLLQQTGSALFSDIVNDPTNPATDTNQDDDNPFLITHDQPNEESAFSTTSLPPASHLHSLIPALLTLKQPVVVILDAFDLFASHPRQSLLYCLLDTVQNCRASAESRGIAVIGVTSRLDTIQLLEKRVKSRFSGRTIRTAPSSGFDVCLSYVRVSLQSSAPDNTSLGQTEWNQLWDAHVENFLANNEVLGILKETYSVTRELKVIARILMQSVSLLTLAQPYLTLKHISQSAHSQRSRPSSLHADNLSYPAICLLIASVHLNTNGQSTFTFEMMFEIFRDQVRASQSAPAQINGGSIGMMTCTRDIAMSAFEGLISAKTFIYISGPSANTAKQFMKYRCALDRGVISKLVEQSGQTNLRRWYDRAK